MCPSSFLNRTRDCESVFPPQHYLVADMNARPQHYIISHRSALSLARLAALIALCACLVYNVCSSVMLVACGLWLVAYGLWLMAYGLWLMLCRQYRSVASSNLLRVAFAFLSHVFSITPCSLSRRSYKLASYWPCADHHSAEKSKSIWPSVSPVTVSSES